MTKTPLRIILSGGGSKGVFQIGALQEIINSGLYSVDRVYGCSIGALLAPYVANEKIQPLVDIFGSIKTPADVFERRKVLGITVPDKLSSVCAFFRLGAYKSVKLVDTIFNRLTPEELEVAQQKCHVVAYDLIKNQERYFTGKDLRIGAQCSSALWLAVPPVPFEEGLYSDGGTTELFPVNYILSTELKTADRAGEATSFQGVYLFVDCDSRSDYTNAKPTNAIELMSNVQWAAALRLAELELVQLQATLEKELILIRPDTNILSGGLDMDPVRMSEFFQAGVRKGQDFVRFMAKF
jgi:Patatin-like phospholipase